MHLYKTTWVSGEQDAEVANLWLLALEMTQIASNRCSLCLFMPLARRPSPLLYNVTVALDSDFTFSVRGVGGASGRRILLVHVVTHAEGAMIGLRGPQPPNPDLGPSHRLVSELSLVERNLDYWLERLRQGKHLRTMLFGQGPVSFAKDVRNLLPIHKSERRDTASERIERRVSVALDALCLHTSCLGPRNSRIK